MRRLFVFVAVVTVLFQSWNPCPPEEIHRAGQHAEATLAAAPAVLLVEIASRRTSPLELLIGRDAGCSLCTTIEAATLTSHALRAPRFGGHPAASRSLQSQQVRWQI